MAEYTAHYNVLHTDCQMREKISDLDDTHSGSLGAKLTHLRSSKVHQDFDHDDTHPGILGAKLIYLR